MYLASNLLKVFPELLKPLLLSKKKPLKMSTGIKKRSLSSQKMFTKMQKKPFIHSTIWPFPCSLSDIWWKIQNNWLEGFPVRGRYDTMTLNEAGSVEVRSILFCDTPNRAQRMCKQLIRINRKLYDARFQGKGLSFSRP